MNQYNVLLLPEEVKVLRAVFTIVFGKNWKPAVNSFLFPTAVEHKALSAMELDEQTYLTSFVKKVFEGQEEFVAWAKSLAPIDDDVLSKALSLLLEHRAGDDSWAVEGTKFLSIVLPEEIVDESLQYDQKIYLREFLALVKEFPFQFLMWFSDLPMVVETESEITIYVARE